MDPLVPCVVKKKAQYIWIMIFFLRLSKTAIFVKMYNKTNIFKHNEFVIFEKINSFDGIRPN